MKKLTFTTILLILVFLPLSIGFSFPVKFVDDAGKTYIVDKKPSRVISLVPTVTEVIYKLGAQDSLKGITYHSDFPGTSNKPIVGGFFEPSIKAIEELNPDVIFISDMHTEVKDHFKGKDVRLIELATSSVLDGIDHILLLGRIFEREARAEAIKLKIDAEIELISKKLNLIKPDKKLRVMRLMGRDSLMTPGSDSFQNELIRMAGGIPHNFNKKGDIVEVTKEEWVGFNPQVLYGCGNDSEIEKQVLTLPGWNKVDAVKNRRIYYFPCDLTCRAATNTGYFIQWLASSIYGKEFALKENSFIESRIFASKDIRPDFDYIEKIRIADTRILDFLNKSLVIDLKTPMTVISTLEGKKKGITTIVNHYTPPQNWLIDHDRGVDSIRKRICEALQKEPEKTSILITGANMDNLSIKKVKFKDLEVRAFVTAGVRSNAMRMGKSKGNYYEPENKPGTINVILMTNMKLSPRAMTRAIITATEAKTAALFDMDIRTSYDDGAFRATGTGTDNVLVVEGEGRQLENTGGHSKLGEMMATVVYEGVKEAVYKQNGLSVDRNIFQRLKTRGITIYDLIATKKTCEFKRDKARFVGAVEELLLEPRYAGFIQMALILSDDYEKGLIKDFSAFEDFSKQIAMEIGGCSTGEIRPIVKKDLPKVIKTGLNALLNGVYYRSE